ncbi:hypothetical protein OAL64_01445, partial [bacterium]|nr:hypothetical protein [bacterium]
GMMLKTWAAEIDVPLSVLSQLLIHPMTPLFLLTTTTFILCSAFTLRTPTQRRKLGHIACVLGLLVLATAILGLILPMVQYSRNLM